ncbi:MAG: tautomerase family protein [Mycetocola sp.]
MPHARIDLHEAHRPRLAELSDAVLAGMVSGFDMPEDDLFQIFRFHAPGELVYSPTFPSQNRDDIIFVEIVAGAVFNDEQKQAAMGDIADNIAALGITRDNVLCVLLEVHGAAWYAAERVRA